MSMITQRTPTTTTTLGAAAGAVSAEDAPAPDECRIVIAEVFEETAFYAMSVSDNAALKSLDDLAFGLHLTYQSAWRSLPAYALECKRYKHHTFLHTLIIS